MGKIRKLNAEVISKIAAGEVIEKPAYAVKELIENSIDAGATYIRIDVEKSGLEKIVVSDNGEGMEEEDIYNSYKQHTTSKLFNHNDLLEMKSLGFRGEALSSIAAVGNLTIKSRVENVSIGCEVQIEDGQLIKASPVGMGKGTVVTVDQLFHNVPTRKKFVKYLHLEFRNILHVVTQYALAFPDIRITFTHNKKNIFNLPQGQSIEERVQIILGEYIFANSVPLINSDEHIHIKGYISKPQLGQTSPSKQFIFINGRSVRSRVIASVIRETYGTLLPLAYFPVFVLFLNIPFEMVDVNVHPRKEEVQFYNENLIRELISESVQQSLNKYNLTFQDKRWKKNSAVTEMSLRDGGTTSYAAEKLRNENAFRLIAPLINKNNTVIQIHNLYLLLQTDTGYLIIDQHAAHERILYEQFEENLGKQLKKVITIVVSPPYTLNLSVMEEELLKEYKLNLKNLGFTISKRKKTFILETVPELFKDRDYRSLINEILETISDKNSSIFDSHTQKMLAYLACRGAVKAGDTLTTEQSIKLLKQLDKVKNPYTCPHGRPIKIEVNLNELAKQFKRT
jgi:DNA mismatch repair protein MutL